MKLSISTISHLLILLIYKLDPKKFIDFNNIQAIVKIVLKKEC